MAEIEAEQALVNANRELIRRMEAKVKAAIDRVSETPRCLRTTGRPCLGPASLDVAIFTKK